MKMKCPECSTANEIPSKESKKITCAQCGVIIILAKVLGEDWADRVRPSNSETRNKSTTEKAKSPVVSRRASAPSVKPASSRHTATRESSRTSHRAHAKPGVSPGLMYSSIGAVLVMVVAGFLIYDNQQDKQRRQDEKTEAAKREREKERIAREAISPADAGSAEGESTPVSSGEKPAALVNEPKPSTESKPAKKPKSTKIRYEDLVAFAPNADRTAEQLEAAAKHIEVLRDLNATKALGVAQDALREMPLKVAIPALINALLKIDCADADDVKRGFQLVEALELISFYSEIDESAAFKVIKLPEDANARQNDIEIRKAAVLAWWKWWDKNAETWELPKDDLDG